MIAVCNLLPKVYRPMACRPESLSQKGKDICKQITPSLATCMQHTSSGKHSRCFILVLAHKMRALIRPLSLVGQSQGHHDWTNIQKFLEIAVESCTDPFGAVSMP